MKRRPPRSTRTDTLFPYTTLFRSDVVVGPRLVAHRAAEQFVHRRRMVLPENVPQGDVDCAQRRHDCRAAEMGPAIHVLPVVLDEARVLADQILGEGRNRAGGRTMEGPATGFPETTSDMRSVWNECVRTFRFRCETQ